MGIDAIHQELVDEGVFARAEEFTNAATDIQDEYTWIGERFRSAYDRLSSEASTFEEVIYLVHLKDAYETLESVVDTIDDARRDFGYVMQQMEQRPPDK